MLRELTDLMMPRRCLVCGRQLGAREKHLCISCSAHLPLTYYWERKHNPMADELNALLETRREDAGGRGTEGLGSRAEGLASPADAAPMPYVYAAALLFYHHENPYKQIPQALKYGGNLAAGRYYAAQLGRYLAASNHFADVDLVVPVPLHWTRRWRRGYNQAAVIAGEIARALGVPMDARLLRRTRHTRTQTRFDAESRLRNVSGIFRVRHLPSGARHILLIDDTFTTGATLATCYWALRAALGPDVRISVATLSAVQD